MLLSSNSHVVCPQLILIVIHLCVCGCVFLYVFQGIQFLLENDLLQHTPEDISQFLYKGEGLNKTAIGDYLGER